MKMRMKLTMIYWRIYLFHSDTIDYLQFRSTRFPCFHLFIHPIYYSNQYLFVILFKSFCFYRISFCYSIFLILFLIIIYYSYPGGISLCCLWHRNFSHKCKVGILMGVTLQIFSGLIQVSSYFILSIFYFLYIIFFYIIYIYICIYSYIYIYMYIGIKKNLITFLLIMLKFCFYSHLLISICLECWWFKSEW